MDADKKAATERVQRFLAIMAKIVVQDGFKPEDALHEARITGRRDDGYPVERQELTLADLRTFAQTAQKTVEGLMELTRTCPMHDCACGSSSPVVDAAQDFLALFKKE